MMKFSIKFFKILPLLFLLMASSCEEKTTVPDGAFEPQARIISGNWVIVKVTRNGNDLTDRLDYSKFNLTFEGDESGGGTYSIVEEMPFVVSQDGTWRFDDPA